MWIAVIKFLDRIFEDRRWVIIIIVLNLIGTVYGYYWYEGQLAATPVVYWPFTPDCPEFAMFFAVVLIFYLYDRRLHNFEVLTFFGLIKYGTWTVFTIALYFMASGDITNFDEWMLLISHVGMTIEGILYFKYLKLSKFNIFISLAWFLLSDYMDYAVGVYPYLPYQAHLPIVRAYAVISTVVIFIFLMYVENNKRGEDRQ